MAMVAVLNLLLSHPISVVMTLRDRAASWASAFSVLMLAAGSWPTPG
jgi:hypothetical protein